MQASHSPLCQGEIRQSTTTSRRYEGAPVFRALHSRRHACLLVAIVRFSSAMPHISCWANVGVLKLFISERCCPYSHNLGCRMMTCAGGLPVSFGKGCGSAFSDSICCTTAWHDLTEPRAVQAFAVICVLAALAAPALAKRSLAQAPASAITDADVLNFALNLVFPCFP